MDGQINPRIDCSQSPLAVRLTPEEVVALDMMLRKEMSEYRRLAKRDLEKPPNLSQVDTVYFCGGGMNSFAINAYGEMGICVISQQETFDVRRAWPRAGLGGFFARGAERASARESPSASSVAFSRCAGCVRRMARWRTEIRRAPVEFLCHVAHLRAAVIGVEVPAHGECEFCVGGSRARGSDGIGAPDREQRDRCGELGRAAADSADLE